MQIEEQLACGHGEFTAGLFCIDDLRKRCKDGVPLHRGMGLTRENWKPGNIRQEVLSFQQEADSVWLYEEIVDSSKTLREAFEYVPSVAPTDCTVLITGEIGTGKRLVAQAMHSLSHRSPGAFVRVDCAAISPSQIALELSGQQKDSWSPRTQPRPRCFEMTEGGTIFLEGVDALSLESQAVLLRCLQEMEFESANGNPASRYKARLIAATNHDLQDAVAKGTFRRDLYYQLNVFPIHVPPLRDRKQDIPVLIKLFLKHYARMTGKNIPDLSSSVMASLQSYPWPGNMLELQYVLERFVNLCEAESFSVDVRWVSSSASVGPIKGIWIPEQKELLEAALLEMLSVLPGWEESFICSSRTEPGFIKGDAFAYFRSSTAAT